MKRLLPAALFAAEPATLMAFDSSIRDPREINVAVSAGRVTRFNENLTDFSGIIQLPTYQMTLGRPASQKIALGHKLRKGARSCKTARTRTRRTRKHLSRRTGAC